jgi:hypothetical protein
MLTAMTIGQIQTALSECGVFLPPTPSGPPTP